MRRAAGTALLALTLVAPGSANALFNDDEARARVERLRSQVELNQKAIDERLARIEAAIASNTAATDRRAILDLAGQLDAMRGDLQRLRGQVEVLVHSMEVAEKRQKDLYLDIDTRLRKLEQAREQAAAAAAAAIGEKPPAPDVTAASPAEAKAYEAALNQFKLGNYPLAISAFQGFLVTYPSSPLAPSAQYWIGNAHYALRDYKNAIVAQQKLLSAWPDNHKAPDAMLNVASSQDAMGDRRSAQKTLEDLMVKYPETPAAASAKQRLTQGTRR